MEKLYSLFLETVNTVLLQPKTQLQYYVSILLVLFCGGVVFRLFGATFGLSNTKINITITYFSLGTLVGLIGYVVLRLLLTPHVPNTFILTTVSATLPLLLLVIPLTMRLGEGNYIGSMISWATALAICFLLILLLSTGFNSFKFSKGLVQKGVDRTLKLQEKMDAQ